MLRTVPLGTEYLLPPVEIGGYKYSVPNGTQGCVVSVIYSEDRIFENHNSSIIQV